MKNSTKANIAYAIAKLSSWAFTIIAIMEMFMQFIINMDYFDSHCAVMAQYPEGLFFHLIGVPVILFAVAVLARCIMFLCHKWYLYERMQEKKRR